MSVTPQTVLDYWLGDTPQSADSIKQKNKLWFQKSFETDREIAETFLSKLADLAAGEARKWAGRGPHERLAAIIVLDQFSRNIFRGHRFSFTHDKMALSLAKTGVSNGEDRALSETERVFLYLPFEHSEALEDQEQSVALFSALASEARAPFKSFCDTVLDYAHQHKDVIERFGRFPHRNAILRRPSTREEQAYLAEPGAGF